MNNKLKNVLLIAFAMSFVGMAPHADANDLLRLGMRNVAEEVKNFLQTEGRRLEVEIGEFEGFKSLQASGGTEISRVFKEEMEAIGVKVLEGAPHLVSGVNNRRVEIENEKARRLQGFRVVPSKPQDEQFESLALEINTLVQDDFGEELAVLPVRVFGSAPLQVSGIDTDLPPSATERERQEATIDQFKNPGTVVTPSRIDGSYSVVSATKASDFGMEILVKISNDLIPRKAELKGGKKRAFIKLRGSEEYVIRIHNNADYEIAVELTVDGVNVFQLADDRKLRDSKIIVGPKTSATIPGWFRNLQVSNQFTIGAFQNAVANKQNAALADIGTITAVIRASFNERIGIPKPADEPTAGAGRKDASPPDEATVVGEQIKKRYSRVKREYGVLRSTISIRYET